MTIEYPSELLQETDERRLAAPAREAFVVKLYEQGLIGSGKGAKMLDISRRDFLDLVGTYNVSIFDENIDFDEDLRRAGAAQRG
jgi:predicted HTH domain antitoxin